MGENPRSGKPEENYWAHQPQGQWPPTPQEQPPQGQWPNPPQPQAYNPAYGQGQAEGYQIPANTLPPATLPPGTFATSPLPPGPITAQSSPSKAKIALIILLCTLLAAGVAAGAWFFFLRDPGESSAGSQGTSASESNNASAVKLDYSSLLDRLQQSPDEAELKLTGSDFSEYPKVKLYFSLRDNSGADLELTSPTALVKERLADGTDIERTIRRVERIENNEGVGFEVLIDKSGSMSSDMDQMQNALKEFINTLDYSVGDKAEILSFDSYLMYMTMFTEEKDLLLNGIDNMTPYGQTALYDALYTGVTNAGNRDGMNCVIAFTDGIDNASMHTSDEVIALAQAREIPIYLIGTSSADSYALNNIAAQTGGYFWDIDSIGDMGEVLNRITATQKSMYTVEYNSDSSLEPYSQRSICVVLYDGDSTDAAGGESNESGSTSASVTNAGSIVGGYLDGYDFTPIKREETVQHSSRYEITQADITWTDASSKCIAKGGHLATITSQNEQDTLTAMASNAGLRFIWLGGYTSVRNSNVFGHWVTGEPFNYSQWRSGEPSRNDRDGEPEFYLMLWYVDDQWSWNDQRNDVLSTGLDYFPGKIGYICEYESVK